MFRVGPSIRRDDRRTTQSWLRAWGQGTFPTLPLPSGTSADTKPFPLQSLLFLGLVAAICLGLNLIFLVVYLVCVCCCRQDDTVQTKQRNSCCVTWTAVMAGLICW